jgi:DNA-binding beta-propeller fold protein YncE
LLNISRSRSADQRRRSGASSKHRGANAEDVTAEYVHPIIFAAPNRCSGQAGMGSQPPIGAPGALPQAPASAVRIAHTAWFVYMAQCCRQEFSNRGNITVYDLQLSKVALSINKGVSNPAFITVDRAGRVYMLSWLDYDQGVVEYDAGSKRPSRRIELPYASVATTDGSNNLYAAVCPSCHAYVTGKGSINEYEAGTTKLLRSITDGIHAPIALAFDTNGNLYALDYSGSEDAALVYAPGSNKPLRSIPQGFTTIGAIALDPSNHLFVIHSPISGAASIVEYKAASNKILRTITNGIESPQAMALDSSGTLYVSNTPFPSNGWVSVYRPGSSAPSYRITSQMNDPQLLAIDHEGNLYVGNDYYAVAAFRTSNTAFRIRWR